MPIAGWGQFPVVEAHVACAEELVPASRGVSLSRGLGRSYGDASLPLAGETVLATPFADRYLEFDEQTGAITVEAGVSVSSILQLFLRRGWFVPVTPGTKYVTIGGMVAADVHGKNHHVAGCFGAHVLSLRLRVGDGRVVECSPSVENELFRATIGGMGLTGHILDVTFRMVRVPSSWIWGEAERMPHLDAFLDGLRRSAEEWPMTMGWIDCLARGDAMGRGILFRGRWATEREAPAKAPGEPRPRAVPRIIPSWALSRLAVRAFNAAYYRFACKPARAAIIHPGKFFYPLDAMGDWYRLYGRRGFTQYQCVLPTEGEAGSVRRFMKVVSDAGGASPLCVIKDCGEEGIGMLSFPRPGISIAIDFPVRSWTQEIVDELNRIVIAEGGRIYLAKDAFTRREDFEQMEPRLREWRAVRRRWDPERRLRSMLGERLLDSRQDLVEGAR